MPPLMVVTPAHRLAPDLATAAARAGGIGILDLARQHAFEDRRKAARALALTADATARVGLRLELGPDPVADLAGLEELLDNTPTPYLVLATPPAECDWANLFAVAHRLANAVYLECYTPAHIPLARRAGFTGVILKGAGAGGVVGATSLIEWIQAIEHDPSFLCWVQGGIGPDIAVAALVAGAAGIVLAEQTWLAAEAPFELEERQHWLITNAEAANIVPAGPRSRRLGPSRTGANAASLGGADPNDPCDSRAPDDLIPLGIDIAFARQMAGYATVGGILDAYRRQISAWALGLDRAPDLAIDSRSKNEPLIWCLAPSGSMAQGAPRLIFRECPAGEVERGTWGGILDSTDSEVRQARLNELLAARPALAIVSGATPAEAQRLEEAGIDHYEFVTNAAALERQWGAGQRRFVLRIAPEYGEELFAWQRVMEVLRHVHIDHPERVRLVVDAGAADLPRIATMAALLVAIEELGFSARLLLDATSSSIADVAGRLDEARGALARARDRLLKAPPPRARAREKLADIAIIGMACLFPKAADLRSYWSNILTGVDAVTEVPPDRWSAADFYSEDRFAPDRVYSKWGGFLGPILFDPMKWKIPPASLESIEPIQLLALETAARAMADAGYANGRPFPRDKTGVLFATAGSHDVGSGYAFRTMMRHYLPKVPDLPAETRERILGSLEEQLPRWTEDSFPGFLLNVVAGRIARELDLNGPNYVVDAACAAALAALHAAIDQLRTGVSDMMLVGAADATNNPFCFMSFSKTHALSPRGRSRPFDDSADGIALGEGVAVVVLKRLADAERDGDKIYAVIRGIGSSSDGKNKSLTAPYPPGQIKAVLRAYDDARVSPATVSLVEAHGTGTAVGDSAEVTTLTEVFQSRSRETHFAGLGSVKSMIGHTKTVAGLASLIKTAMALDQRVLPPTIGIETPSGKIDFAKSPFYLSTEARPWIDDLGEHPRRAAVSAFGFGGTNFHVVLEEYVQPAERTSCLSPRPSELFTWQRDRREDILRELAAWKTALGKLEVPNLADLAHAAARAEEGIGTTARTCRLAMVADSTAQLKERIERAISALNERNFIQDSAGIFYSEGPAVAPAAVCFLYPGQGSQLVNMLRDLVAGDPFAQALFGRTNRLLEDFLPRPLSRYIYPPPVFSEAERKQLFADLSDTRVAQPALGAVEIFATALLARFGITPAMAAGHSYGEHVALYAAGCLTEEELLSLSATRGHVCAELAQACPGGMVAVRADAETTRMAIADLKLPAYLANLNAPDQTIIAGADDVMNQAVEQLRKHGIFATRIPVTAPFHTPLLAEGAEIMARHFARASFTPPRFPVYSNTTAAAHSADPAAIRDLLARHFSEPVHFEREIRALYADGARVFIEVGPGKVLTNLVGRILVDQPVVALSLDAPGRNGWTQFAHLLGQVYAAGLPVRVSEWTRQRGLPDMDLDVYWAKLEADAAPGRGVWKVGPSGASPLVPLPTRKRTQARPAETHVPPAKAANPATPSSVPPVAPVPSAPLTEAAAAMANTAATSGCNPVPSSPPKAVAPVHSLATSLSQPLSQARVNESHGTASTHSSLSTIAPLGSSTMSSVDLFSQYQATTRMLLELQIAQQRTLERFVESQERVLLHCLAGGGPVPLALPTPALPAVEASVPLAPTAPVVKPPIVTPSAPVVPRTAHAPAPPRSIVPATPSVPTVPTAPPRAAKLAPTPAAAQAPVLAPALAPAPVAPVAPVATVATVATSGNGSGPPPTEVFKNDLLQIVSERTGYPVDMLDIELPLEAGLGIDSIKTVEIFSNLKDYHVYFNEEGQDEEEVLAAFTRLKTLKDIIDSYDQRLQKLTSSNGAGKAPQSNGASANGDTAARGIVEHFAVTSEPAPAGEGSKKNFPMTTSSS